MRMVAHPKLNQINGGIVGDFSLLLSNNANTGGLCFGDSGGPNFVGDSNVIGGVSSFALNGNCAGTGGVFRLDRSWSLNLSMTTSNRARTVGEPPLGGSPAPRGCLAVLL